MQTNEFKAILAKTREIAIRPVPICNEEATKRNAPQKGWNRRGYVCPTGLTKATVIDTNVPWVEKRPVSQCGDQDYEINRKNGILVEYELTDAAKKVWTVKDGKLVTKPEKDKESATFALTEVVERDGKHFCRTIISVRVVYAAWGEYAMQQAEREKKAAEEAAKYERLYSAQAALLGIDLDGLKKLTDKGGHGLSVRWDETYEYKKDGDYKRDRNGNRVKGPDRGTITLPIEQAEKILAVLTDDQKKKLATTA